jgi:hypothetical protein
MRIRVTNRPHASPLFGGNQHSVAPMTESTFIMVGRGR